MIVVENDYGRVAAFFALVEIGLSLAGTERTLCPIAVRSRAGRPRARSRPGASPYVPRFGKCRLSIGEYYWWRVRDS